MQFLLLLFQRIYHKLSYSQSRVYTSIVSGLGIKLTFPNTLLPNSAYWWQFLRWLFSGKKTTMKSSIHLSLEHGACLLHLTELPALGARALLMISDISLIIALSRHSNLSSQVWWPINNSLGTGGSVPEAALSHDLLFDTEFPSPGLTCSLNVSQYSLFLCSSQYTTSQQAPYHLITFLIPRAGGNGNTAREWEERVRSRGHWGYHTACCGWLLPDIQISCSPAAAGRLLEYGLLRSLFPSKMEQYDGR